MRVILEKEELISLERGHVARGTVDQGAQCPQGPGIFWSRFLGFCQESVLPGAGSLGAQDPG